MPELPEVEAVCSRIRPDVVGKRISRVLILRPGSTLPQSPEVLEQVAGRTIRGVERRGKNIALWLSGGLAVRVHLRMTGDLRVLPDARLHGASARVIFGLSQGRALAFNDPRALGRVHLHTKQELEEMFQKLGVEPLSPGFSPDLLGSLTRRSRLAVKLFLLDQGRIAGVGNIYAAEALFRSGIDPRKPADRLRGPRIARLHNAIVAVLGDAVESTRKVYAHPDGFAEAEWFECAVYGREGEPCIRCGRRVRRIRQGARSTYFCPGCQT